MDNIAEVGERMLQVGLQRVTSNLPTVRNKRRVRKIRWGTKRVKSFVRGLFIIEFTLLSELVKLQRYVGNIALQLRYFQLHRLKLVGNGFTRMAYVFPITYGVGPAFPYLFFFLDAFEQLFILLEHVLLFMP